MNGKTISLLLAVTALLSAAPPAMAQRTINYQGRLTDADGRPINGTKTMLFAFYDVETGGSRLGSFDEKRDVTVSNGIFNVLIGSQTTGGVPVTIFRDNDSVYLSVTVEAEELLPRKLITWSPKAMVAETAKHAEDADLLDGKQSIEFAASNHTHALGTIATDAEILAAVKRVDGSGSGLDADLLDGKNSTEFATAAHQHDSRYVNLTGDTMSGSLATTGSLYADRGVVALGTSGSLFPLWIPPIPGLHGIGADNTIPSSVGVLAEGGGGSFDLAFRSLGALNWLTHDNKGAYIVPGDGANSPAITIGPYGQTGTTQPLMAFNGGVRATSLTSTGTVIAGNHFYGDRSLYLGSPAASGHLHVRDTANVSRAWISGTTGNLYLRDNANTTTIDMRASGGIVYLRDSSNTTNVTLRGSTGRITCKELEITGGADLSEKFSVSGEDIKPGMVVSIDPQQPGDLRVATAAYDRTVAGIISGANGVRPGLTLRQEGSIADGDYPVALTGRVYCYVDASYGAIEPGDILTTSDTPGHAMKVTDFPRAQGAAIGKAMTGLQEGRGLVLVLVNLN